MIEKVVHVGLAGRAYNIHIGTSLNVASLVASVINSPKIVIVTNTTVAPLYLENYKNQLQQAGFNITTCILPDGEDFKTLATVDTIFTTMLDNRLGRDATLLALGGGVIGDMVGFAAACYQRGIKFVQVPTTLLSQVDSSVGGKTGVNHALGKNMIGAFKQPQLVIADIDSLQTLPSRELSAGLAEVIKYGLIRDAQFFEWIEQHTKDLLSLNNDTISYAVQRSCEHKAYVVEVDEFEQGERALLNLGHTFGHAIETAMGYGTYLHGEAVAIGTVIAARLSCLLGNLTQADVERIENIMLACHLPVKRPQNMSDDTFIKYMMHDKKNVAGQLRLILLKSIGQAYIASDVPIELVKQAIELS